MEPRKWYAVATQPNRESVAQTHMARQKFDAFLPTRRSTIRHATRMRSVLTPLFPGYVFVSFNPAPAAIRAVNGTRGVKYLLSMGELPCALPAGFVETLLSALDIDGSVSRCFALSPGDSIRIDNGPFVRQIGELLKLDDRGRVTVLLEMLSGHVPVTVSATDLLPA